MELWPSQTKAIDDIYEWFKNNKTGNLVVVSPGGSGKSVIIGSFISGAVKKWPQLRILMLVHSKELVAQNADKLRKIWPNAPMGIYSSALNKRELGEPITYAGVASVAKRSAQLGHIDICLVDECHAISNTESGMYRNLIAELTEINPKMRVLGFSASPYRTGQGMLTDGDLFTDSIEVATIQGLVYEGKLAPLRSKITEVKLSTEGLKKHVGDFQSKDMQAKFNTSELNHGIAAEIIEVAANRKHWLIFCSGVEHSKDFSEVLNSMGIKADHVSGKDSPSDRDEKLRKFAAGEIRALCNVNILTTGYDFPALDCIAMLRGTTSPGLYLQIAVRGMRIAEGKKDCLVLDFCGNVSRHGPVTNVQPPRKKGEKGGEAPVKPCPECDELLHMSCMICTCCGYEFPKREKEYSLGTDCIMGINYPETMNVRRWRWSKHVSKKTNIEMLKLTYYGDLSVDPIVEYFFPNHEELTKKRSMAKLNALLEKAGVSQPMDGAFNIDNASTYLNNNSTPPDSITIRKNGKFYDVLSREWCVKKKQLG